jgi:hypothetical protein
MCVRIAYLLTALVLGLTTASCASLEGNGERGGTIRDNQLRPGSQDAMANAAQYCRQFGRSAHLASQEIGLVWSETIVFDCI